jgi:hypothetical protein
LLAVRTVALAATDRHRDDLLIRVLREPGWRDRFRDDAELPAYIVLHDLRVLDPNAINAFPSWDGTKWHYPQSHWLRATLAPIFVPLVGDEEAYKVLSNRTEYRIAVVQHLGEEVSGSYKPASGEFVGEWAWTHDDDSRWAQDFRRHADPKEWIGGSDPSEFDRTLDALTDTLRHYRRFG